MNKYKNVLNLSIFSINLLYFLYVIVYVAICNFFLYCNRMIFAYN